MKEYSIHLGFAAKLPSAQRRSSRFTASPTDGMRGSHIVSDSLSDGMHTRNNKKKLSHPARLFQTAINKRTSPFFAISSIAGGPHMCVMDGRIGEGLHN